MNTLFFFNTNIVPGEAIVRVSKIDEITARKICRTWPGEKLSAIGHEATATAMGEILMGQVYVNRIFAQPKDGDKAISLKLNGRLPEGQVLSLEELNTIGFELYLLEFYSPHDFVIMPGS